MYQLVWLGAVSSAIAASLEYLELSWLHSSFFVLQLKHWKTSVGTGKTGSLGQASMKVCFASIIHSVVQDIGETLSNLISRFRSYDIGERVCCYTKSAVWFRYQEGLKFWVAEPVPQKGCFISQFF